jgi:anhydro-N-acetylmuramic acid kinase
MSMKFYTVVGMMSGTSLDGMDLVLCRFHRFRGAWHYRIIKSVTCAYSGEWKTRLTQAAILDAASFVTLHRQYGRHIGERIRDFLKSNQLKADIVASHGHTIFHKPEERMTFQLGCGASIAAGCGIGTISDFRTLDVALGGQGAPLVPVGDELLFKNYAFCLNLGGFANISHHTGSQRIACDICPVNIVANQLAQKKGMEYDRDGLLGSHGRIVQELVSALNGIGYYERPAPKSLGREWVEDVFMPVLNRYPVSVEDQLRSIYEHIAIQICSYINRYEAGEVLVTGGGAFNRFLMELLRQKSGSALVVPDEQLVKYKEAIIFAFLGLLRYRGEINCLASVTGARTDSSSGIIHLHGKGTGN